MEMTLGSRGSSSLEGRPAYPYTAGEALDGVGRGCTIPLPLIFGWSTINYIVIVSVQSDPSCVAALLD